MLCDFKINDNNRHVWNMSVIGSNNCHCITVTSPKGAEYAFCWRNGELVHVSARGKISRALDDKYYISNSSFREVVSLIPMWLLKKMDFYYKVHIAE